MSDDYTYPADSACGGHPHPQWWDSAVEGEQRWERDARHEAALAVCRRKCPVREACAAAVDPERDDGVRGGRVLKALSRPAALGYPDGRDGHGRARKAG